MTAKELEQLKYTIVITAELCGRVLSDLALKTFAADLEKYPLPKLLQALATYRKKGKFPSVEDIEKEINPEMLPTDEGRIIAGKIMESIAKFGYTHAYDAQKHMGPRAWSVVTLSGGWLEICQGVNDKNRTTYMAQFRDLAESLSKRERLPDYAMIEEKKCSTVKNVADHSSRD